MNLELTEPALVPTGVWQEETAPRVTGSERLLAETLSGVGVARATEPPVCVGKLVEQILFLSLGLTTCEEYTPLSEVL